VSIWTTSGRVKNVAFTASPEQLATPALYRKGESDLLERDGMWFLDATCEVPEAPLNTGPVDFLGVDLGLVNIATTSDGEIMAGRELNRTRLRERGLRTKLQKKNTPSAKRRLKKRRRKEARRARDINHKIAKHVVTEAGGYLPRPLRSGGAPVAESPWKTWSAPDHGHVRHAAHHGRAARHAVVRTGRRVRPQTSYRLRAAARGGGRQVSWHPQG
jgi:hypothetical protein